MGTPDLGTANHQADAAVYRPSVDPSVGRRQTLSLMSTAELLRTLDKWVEIRSRGGLRDFGRPDLGTANLRGAVAAGALRLRLVAVLSTVLSTLPWLAVGQHRTFDKWVEIQSTATRHGFGRPDLDTANLQIVLSLDGPQRAGLQLLWPTVEQPRTYHTRACSRNRETLHDLGTLDWDIANP